MQKLEEQKQIIYLDKLYSAFIEVEKECIKELFNNLLEVRPINKKDFE